MQASARTTAPITTTGAEMAVPVTPVEHRQDRDTHRGENVSSGAANSSPSGLRLRSVTAVPLMPRQNER